MIPDRSDNSEAFIPLILRASFSLSDGLEILSY
nr:MAG TPA: hypothetical protein [Caudoviricetes sp.]